MNPEIYDRLKKISQKLKEEYHAEKVILFGSYAREEGTEDSDVDLLVIAPTQQRMIDRMTSVSLILWDITDTLPVSPIVLTPEEFREKLEMRDAFIGTIVEEGLEL